MASESRLELRVSRLENDTSAIYELLADMKAVQDHHSVTLSEHSTILSEHSTVLAEHSTVLAEHSTILSEHSGRFDRIDATLSEVLRRLPEPT